MRAVVSPTLYTFIMGKLGGDTLAVTYKGAHLIRAKDS